MSNLKSIYSPLGASNHSKHERAKQDYYATHPSAIDYLFEVEDFSSDIWECACGGGHLSKRMEQRGKNVWSTDLIDRGFGETPIDFLAVNRGLFNQKELAFNGDIITNPPYKLADKFVEKAMKLVDEGKKVAFFLKLTFLEGKSRVKLFEKHPPKNIWVFSFRTPVARNGEEEMFEKSSAVCYAWFVWQKGFSGKPTIGWIKERKGRVQE